MIKITKYVANDGQVFDTREECKRHEEQTLAANMARHGLKVWKQDGERYMLVPATFSGLLEATLISVPTSAARDFLKQIGNDSGIEVPREVGDWYYDDECEKWCDYSHYHDAMTAFKFMKEHGQSE